MTLMVECGWDAIEVQTLCDRANIGRSTFYQHYASKEALLKASLASLRDALLYQQGDSPGKPAPLAFVPGLVAHAYEARDVFRALLGRRSGQYVQDRFREMLIELVQAGLVHGESPGWQAAAQAHYLGGALFELLAWWLRSNRPQKPQDIDKLFVQWSQSVLTPHIG